MSAKGYSSEDSDKKKVILLKTGEEPIPVKVAKNLPQVCLWYGVLRNKMNNKKHRP